jgi:hypothetical protein
MSVKRKVTVVPVGRTAICGLPGAKIGRWITGDVRQKRSRSLGLVGRHTARHREPAGKAM